MPRSNRVTCFVLLASCACATEALAQSSADEQTTHAVLAAPEGLRDAATVLGYGGQARDGDALTLLREGSNGIVCLADDPADDRFHVACYHESMDPFMALGRRLRAEGMGRDEVVQARGAAIEAGEIEPPSAALWSLTAPAGFDPADEASAEGAQRLSVVYVPYAEGDELGLPTRPDGDSPWLMLPGTPWAHIMIAR